MRSPLERALSTVGRGLAGALLLALLAGGSAWLLSPGDFPRRLPDEAALGTVARGNLSVHRSYDIVDEDATRAARVAAAGAERPVYAWDEGAAEDAAARVRSAFARMRESLRGPASPSPLGTEPHRLAAPEREELEERLGVPVGDADFAALSAAGFSEQLESELAALLRAALSGYLVDDPRTLSELRELDRGMVARAVRRGAPGSERVLVDLDLVRSVRSVRDEVVSAATRLELGPPARLALGHLAAALVKPTVAYDLPETARRRSEASDRVKPVVVHLRRGERILAEGEVIDRHHLLLFQGIRDQTRAIDVLAVRLGAAGLVALLALLLWMAARRSEGPRPGLKDAAVLTGLLLVTATAAAASLLASDLLHDRFPWIPADTFLLLLPFAAATLVVRNVLGARLALPFGVASGALAGLAAGGAPGLLLHAVVTALAAAALPFRTRGARGLFRSGMALGLVGALVAAGTTLVTGRSLGASLAPAAAAALGGALLVPVSALLMLLLLQRLYLTERQLLRLASLNHPALKDLIIQAPGTYHHALVTGALAEAAARAAGARPLLARVGAYYHDVGKLENPGAYGENQRAEPAASIAAPAAGAALVKRHVADGLSLARRWQLPREVQEIIREHHGTRHVASYWSRAQARAREAGEAPPDEAPFRYAGPIPRSREAALVMLADVVEASASALPEHDEASLRALVARRAGELFAEGQLRDCDLTLRQLAAAERAVAEVLVTLHGERARRGGGAGEADVRSLQLVGGAGRGLQVP